MAHPNVRIETVKVQTQTAGLLKTGTVLPVARYRFTARAERTLQLPEYSGSLLRGVFGAALRQATCVTGGQHCPACPLYLRCPYPAIFEAPPRPTALPQQFSQVPNPYVIEPPPLDTSTIPKGGELRFHVVLVGPRALAWLPLLITAWRLACLQGLGHQRTRLNLERVQWCGQQQEIVDVWDVESGRVLPHEAVLAVPPPPSEGTGLSLNCVTPLRLQHQGKPLKPNQLNVRSLVLAVVRRASLMLELHMESAPPDISAILAQIPAIGEDRTGLRWRDWTRYSSRQRQEMVLGGVLGAWSLRSPTWQLLWPWLWLGQWLHVGKNATMGLGGYHIQVET